MHFTVFRETTEEALLQRAGADIQAHFSQFPDFEPLSLFIATWDAVAAYKGDSKSVSKKLNTCLLFSAHSAD